MVMPLDSQEDFWIVVSRSIRIFLPRQRKNHSRIFLAHRRRPVTAIASGDLNARPLPPKINPSGRFDHLVDVSATYARRAFEEVEISAGVCLNEFCVGHAAHQA